MTELDEPFRGVDGAFKPPGEKSIPVQNLLPFKKTESVGCDVVQSHERLISSETTSWSA